jgi:hypothetical protein
MFRENLHVGDKFELNVGGMVIGEGLITRVSGES